MKVSPATSKSRIRLTPTKRSADASAERELRATPTENALKERSVPQLRFGPAGRCGKKPGLVGRELGITRERARQIERDARQAARRYLGMTHMADYLY